MMRCVATDGMFRAALSNADCRYFVLPFSDSAQRMKKVARLQQASWRNLLIKHFFYFQMQLSSRSINQTYTHFIRKYLIIST